MTIWHLTRTLSGGAGQYALRLSRALEAAGTNSVVLSVEGPELAGSRVLVRRGGRVRSFGCRAQRSWMRRVSKGAFHSLRGWERYELPSGVPMPDIVHLHGMTGWIGVSGLEQLIPPEARVFQTTHCPWDFSGGCVLRAGAGCDGYKQDCGSCPMLKTPWQPFARMELKLRDRWVRSRNVTPIANSRWMAERVAESRVFRSGGEVPVIPPIVSDVYLQPGRSGFREELDVGGDRWLIGLGAKAVTDTGKGIQAFVERLGEQEDLAARATVVLFGDGEFAVPNGLDIRFLGPIDDKVRLAEVYRSLDVFVSPSVMETFGMTLVEAQACGTPVVGFDTGGIRDAFDPDRADCLVPLGDWDRLFLKTGEVLHDGATQPGGSRDWVASHFAGPAIARKQLGIYGDIRSRRGQNGGMEE